jgi:hypothetical protein
MHSLVSLPKHSHRTLRLRHQCRCPNLLRRHRSTCKLRQLWLHRSLHRHCQQILTLHRLYHCWSLPRHHQRPCSHQGSHHHLRHRRQSQSHPQRCLFLSPLRHHRSQSRLQWFLCLKLPKHSQPRPSAVPLFEPSQTLSANSQAPSSMPSSKLLRRHWLTRKLRRLCLCRFLHKHRQLPGSLQESHHLPRLHRNLSRLQKS